MLRDHLCAFSAELALILTSNQLRLREALAVDRSIGANLSVRVLRPAARRGGSNSPLRTSGRVVASKHQVRGSESRALFV